METPSKVRTAATRDEKMSGISEASIIVNFDQIGCRRLNNRIVYLSLMHGGELVSKALVEEKVKFLFTLCGGHISPILVASIQAGIRVVDTRHEANAVFAADAVARITGVPGVAVVTAGPGITNTVTAVRNALLAQSPIVLLGGAAPTLLKGRGALQDIDQISLMKPNVKWQVAVRRVRDIYPAVKNAFATARDGVPGPVFVELPLDVLYEESIVRAGFEKTIPKQATLLQRMTAWYIRRHLNQVFQNSEPAVAKPSVTSPKHSKSDIDKTVACLRVANKPVMLVGSGAMMLPTMAPGLAEALNKLSIPVYLSGMARGLLGAVCDFQFRHNRKDALKEADMVILAGVPCDFRLDYGRHINRNAKLIAINRSKTDLTKNRKPNIGVLSDPLMFLVQMANAKVVTPGWEEWKRILADRERKREETIASTGLEPNGLHPVQLLRGLDAHLPDDSVIVADGGDFVGTSSYILRPRRPLSWLDPGVFGTLGIGGGFAAGAKLCRPESEVIILYGDGSAGYSLSEFDTFVRHKLPVIAIVGNDARWSQIARDQLEILKDDTGINLNFSDYHKVAEAFGGKGRRAETMDEFISAFAEARESVKEGVPYLINAILVRSDFRRGSISM